MSPPNYLWRDQEWYLIWSNEHRAWWRSNGRGYTIDVGDAGRYTKLDAIQHSRSRDQRPEEPLPEIPVRLDDILSVLVPPPDRTFKRNASR